MRTRRILLASCSALLVNALSCSVYDESLLDSGDGGAGPGKGGSKCKHASWPDPPAGKDLGGDIEVVGAMSSVSFGDPKAVDEGMAHYSAIGFDLDMTCTGQGEGDSCVMPDWAANVDHTDGVDGRDNSVGALIAIIQQLQIPEFGSQTYNSIVDQGKVTILFRIRGYNGLPNDDKVEASLYVGAPFDSLNEGAKPRWDGTDRWPIASDSLKDGEDIDNAKYFDPHGYVTDGVLVATLPEATLRLANGLLPGNAGEINMKLVGAFLAGKLVEVDTPDGKRWELQDVHLGGRWPTDDLVHQLSQFAEPPNFTKPLCMNSPTYSIFRNQLCSYTDIFAGIGGPTSICNAISFGLSLQTRPAYLDGVVQVTPPDTNRCPAEADPVQDACGKPIPTFD